MKPGRKEKREQGFLLIAVLVIVMLASMVALSLIFRVRAEQASFSASVGAEQAWYAAMSGVQQAMHMVKAGVNDPPLWQSNPGAFLEQLVIDDGSDKWYFTIYSPAVPGESGIRYGVGDENAKLNLNKATAEMLQKATWLSPAQIREIAGEDGALSNVLSPDLLTSISSRPTFSTMDELLRLQSLTPGIIYGEDANHNFGLEPNEDDGRLQFPPDDGDGQLFLGLQEVATVFSYERNVTEGGTPRIQLNSTNGTVLPEQLPEQTKRFIELAWANGKIFKSPADLLGAKEKFKDAEGQEVEVESGVGVRELPLILDQFTTSFEARRVGLININTASVKVLGALPGVDEGKAETIYMTREGLPMELRGSPAWLLQEGMVTAEEFKKMEPLITAKSFQFRFNVIGYGIPSGRFRVYEVVIDTAQAQPQITYLRDITLYGLPFPLRSVSEETNVQSQPQT